MKIKLFFAVSLIALSLFTIRCKKDEPKTTNPVTPAQPVTADPSFQILGITEITYNSAMSSIYIHQLGSETAIEAGLCWSESPEPTPSDNKITVDLKTGKQPVSLLNLKSGTLYYIRAYVINASGTHYVLPLLFHTPGAWTLSGQIQGKITTMLSIDGKLFAGTESNGLYYSINDGQSWLPTGLSSQKIRALCANGHIVYAGTTNGVFYGTSLTTWSQANAGLDSLNIRGMVTYGQETYVLTGSQLYRKSNEENTWTKLSLPNSITPSLIWSTDVGISIHNSQNNTMYYWDENLLSFTYIGFVPYTNPYVVKNLRTKLLAGSEAGNFISMDNGDKWFQIIDNNNYLTSAVRDFTENSGSIYAASGNNVYLTGDDATDWKPLSTGLPGGNSKIMKLLQHSVYVFAVSENNSVQTLYKLNP